MMRTLVLLLAATLTLSVQAVAQDKKEAPPIPKGKEKVDQPKSLKDPTEPSPKLKEILNPARGGGPGAKGGAIVMKLPKIKVRGLIVAGEQRAAYLEVDGENMLVHVGDIITYAGGRTVQLIDAAALDAMLKSGRALEPASASRLFNSDSDMMRILAITEREVIMEGFGGIIVLR